MSEPTDQIEESQPLNRAERRAAERDKKRNPAMPVSGSGVKTLGRVLNAAKSSAPQRRSGHR